MEITVFALAARYLPVFPSRESISHVAIEYAPLRRPIALPGETGLVSWNRAPIVLSLGVLLGVGLLVLNASQKEERANHLLYSGEVHASPGVTVQVATVEHTDGLFQASANTRNKLAARSTDLSRFSGNTL